MLGSGRSRTPRQAGRSWSCGAICVARPSDRRSHCRFCVVRTGVCAHAILSGVRPHVNRLPRVVQRLALTALTATARLGLSRRRAPLPPIGEHVHLTAVLRLGATLVPEITTTNLHYIYPPETVHVTVSNLDATNVDVEEAIERLAARRLSAPTFTVGGLGCSPDTLFLRCIHDERFDRLRLAVEQTFELPPSGSPMSWLFRRLSFANVVRFDGPGEWQELRHSRAEARCTTLEIVRTDRYLSLQGTTVIRAIPLQSTG